MSSWTLKQNIPAYRSIHSAVFQLHVHLGQWRRLIDSDITIRTLDRENYREIEGVLSQIRSSEGQREMGRPVDLANLKDSGTSERLAGVMDVTSP